MTTYHVNPETGRANICRAQSLDSCPLKSDDGSKIFHGSNKEEAKQHGLTLLENRYGAMGSVQKGTTSAEPKTPEHIQKEIDKAYAKKAKEENPEKLKKINTTIRGLKLNLEAAKNAQENGEDTNEKSIKKTLSKAARTEKAQEVPKVRSNGALNSPVQRPKVEDIPDSAIRVIKKSKPVEESPKAPVVIEPELTKLFDKELRINDKKEILADYLNNSKNFKNVESVYSQQGYSLEDSNVVKGLLAKETGNNAVIREAIREAENNGDTNVVDVLMYAEDADESSSTVFAVDRFSEPSYSTLSDLDDDLEIDLEEAPEFLTDDPDFAIEDEDEEDIEED